MVSLKDAIAFVKQDTKGLIVDSYMETESQYIFPVKTPNGGDGTTYFYEVNKTTGDHGTFSDFWLKLMTDPAFGDVVSKAHKLPEIG